MKKIFAAIVLATVFGATSANAAFVPVSGALTTFVDASAEGGILDSHMNSMPVSTVIDTTLSSCATSIGMAPDMEPMSDAMADASVILFENGFSIMGSAYASVTTGSGDAASFSELSFTFELTEDSECMLYAESSCVNPFVLIYPPFSSLYLQDSTGQNIMALTEIDDPVDTIIELSAGQYTVTALGTARVESYMHIPDRVWDSSGMYKLDMTVVPEPATMSMLGLGLLGLIRRNRK